MKLILSIILSLAALLSTGRDGDSRAYIESVSDGVYTISVGAADGVVQDAVFTVYRTGKVLEDPETGTRMERPGIKYGQLTVIALPEKGGAKCSYEGKPLDDEDLSKYHIIKK